MEKTLQKFYDLLPESLRTVAARYNQPLDSATADYLRDELKSYRNQAAAESLKSSCIDIELVDRMVASLNKLLTDFNRFNDAEKMVISAAVRYFLDSEDAQLDFSDRFGFDDDLAVLNAALLAIGKEELIVVRS
ncbi:MAG: hypothetical protein CVV42_10740 [Candidatus Riflebacteria bacterium HGW-Riflebacteria-2]|nr:MAG: hypothetical protein CVV42_10740 [Candidatus Riflebacteria bacterium HGW-Riflebacteria-2]